MSNVFDVSKQSLVKRMSGIAAMSSKGYFLFICTSASGVCQDLKEIDNSLKAISNKINSHSDMSKVNFQSCKDLLSEQEKADLIEYLLSL